MTKVFLLLGYCCGIPDSMNLLIELLSTGSVGKVCKKNGNFLCVYFDSTVLLKLENAISKLAMSEDLKQICVIDNDCKYFSHSKLEYFIDLCERLKINILYFTV